MTKKNEVQKPLANYENNLEALLQKGVDAIPTTINSERLKLNALMAIASDPKLMVEAQKQPAKIAQFVFNLTLRGIDLLAREAYIIPYNGKLQVVLDYKGEKKLAMQYSVKPIRQIIEGVVFEKDTLKWADDGSFRHEFEPFSLDRGKKVGAYCTIIYKDGTRADTFVNTEEIQKVRDVSPSSNSASSPWNKWTESMWIKTAVKKALKGVFLDFENTKQQEAYIESNQDVVFDNQRQSVKEVEEVEIVEMEFIDVEYNESTGEVVDTEVVINLD